MGPSHQLILSVVYCLPKKPPSPYSFDVESPIKNKNIKYILSIIVLLFVAGGIATLIFLLINTNDDDNDI